MKDLLEFLQNNWDVLKKAPLTFALLVLLAGGSGFVAVKWYYEGQIQTLKERDETQKVRLAAKDEQLNEYRQRLQLVPATGTSYSRLTNEELQRKALQVTDRLRQFLTSETMKEGQQMSEWAQMSTAKSEERNRIWKQYTDSLLQSSIRVNTEYDSRFKVDAILLRDELLSRLPKQLKNEQAYSMYEHPTNRLGMQGIADDLERLAKSLPK